MNYPETEIKRITEVLKAGKTILYPTDTIWGIGCDARHEEAVAKIREIKGSPESEKFILLVSNLEMLKQYIQPVPPKASNLIQYHERPLTIVYQQVQNLPSSLLSVDGSIAIRVVQDPFCQAMIEDFGSPIIATSAQLHQEDYPKSFLEIHDSIKTAVDYIVPFRQEAMSDEGLSPSRIVGLDNKNELIFLRK